MTIGFLMGIFRMLVDTPVSMRLRGFENGYAPGSALWVINHVNFQYFSVLITIVSAVVMVAVSWATQRPSPEQIRGLTFGTTTRQQRLTSRESWSWGDLAASACVLAAIAAAYLYFTG